MCGPRRKQLGPPASACADVSYILADLDGFEEVLEVGGIPLAQGDAAFRVQHRNTASLLHTNTVCVSAAGRGHWGCRETCHTHHNKALVINAINQHLLAEWELVLRGEPSVMGAFRDVCERLFILLFKADSVWTVESVNVFVRRVFFWWLNADPKSPCSLLTHSEDLCDDGRGRWSLCGSSRSCPMWKVNNRLSNGLRLIAKTHRYNKEIMYQHRSLLCVCLWSPANAPAHHDSAAFPSAPWARRI